LLPLLLAGVLMITLIFGLMPRNYRFSNGAAWHAGKHGLHFNNFGIAYTSFPAPMDPKSPSIPKPFTIEMVLKTTKQQNSRFNSIVCIHNGDDGKQLLVGQWRSHMIVMNGNDYAHKRRDPRISMDISKSSNQSVLVTIASSQAGTYLYMDGRHVKTNIGLKLNLPDGKAVWLIIGNSIYGKHAWSGKVGGLALYDQPISAQKAKAHFEKWRQTGSLSFAIKDRPRHLYLFDEKKGDIVTDYGESKQNLQIPRRFKILKKQFLAAPWAIPKINKNILSDFTINLFGFVPLGFVLANVLSSTNKSSGKQVLFYVIVLGFGVSLFIEITQAWLPSRSSNLHDLVLNTLGTWIGAIIARQLHVEERRY
jgi:VanZ family protein